MKKRKRTGLTLLAVGVVLAISSLAADAIGIGGEVGFGFKQTIGVVAGFVVGMTGYIIYSMK